MGSNHNPRPVKTIDVGDNKSISKLLSEMSQTGFQGKKLGEIVNIWKEMVKDEDITIIMGYTGSLSTTGQWKIINWLIENRYIDVLVPTGANISEDIVEAMGFNYYQGDHNIKDIELRHSDYNRYYDVYGSEQEYMAMIKLIAEFYNNLDSSNSYTTIDLLYRFGLWLYEKGVKSIVAIAAKNKVPIYCPAIVDSPYGDAAMLSKNNGKTISIDAIADNNLFMSLAEKVKETAVIYIGGGVPKDVIQLLGVSSPLMYNNLAIPGRRGFKHETTGEHYYPHKYAIQITTDSPQWGGLSGCTFNEAISWGKIADNGRFAQCYCDATIALPLVTHALAENIELKRDGQDFSWMFK